MGTSVSHHEFSVAKLTFPPHLQSADEGYIRLYMYVQSKSTLVTDLILINFVDVSRLRS